MHDIIYKGTDRNDHGQMIDTFECEGIILKRTLTQGRPFSTAGWSTHTDNISYHGFGTWREALAHAGIQTPESGEESE